MDAVGGGCGAEDGAVGWVWIEIVWESFEIALYLTIELSYFNSVQCREVAVKHDLNAANRENSRTDCIDGNRFCNCKIVHWAFLFCGATSGIRVPLISRTKFGRIPA